MRGAISTHAPRTGSDADGITLGAAGTHFNPRSPHGERHDGRRRTSAAAKDFNPRSPHGERRAAGTKREHEQTDFNPRSPHGERQGQTHTRRLANQFQPTLPARGATSTRPRCTAHRAFQPTLPARGATTNNTPRKLKMRISTHAPRTGSDMTRAEMQAAIRKISTHAPRTGSDRGGRTRSCPRRIFQPTLPARGATRQLDSTALCARFQPTLPARGATGAEDA